MAESANLGGPEKAAVLLMSLGEGAAAEVLKHMGPKEVQKIGVAMANLENVPKDAVHTALREFMVGVSDQTALGVGSEEYIRRVLVDALGQEKANGMIDRILLGANSTGLEALKWMEPKAIAEMIRLEHPQITAIVLSYLDGDQAAAVMSLLPQEQRSDVLLRIATLNGVQPSAMNELNEILEKQLRGGASAQSSSIGGVKAAANILNYLQGDIESAVLEKVKEVDGELGQEIEVLMFVFENLGEVDDRGIQTLLREVSTDSLVLALKGTDERVSEKVFKNMSQRAAEMLKDDLEAKGPVRLSEVEAAQKEILAIARRLAEEGQIALGGGGGEDMVG